MKKEKKLKPIMFKNEDSEYHRDNKTQQNILLNAMQTTTDLDELKKIAGFHTKAQVLRTLDKLAIRKEYHYTLEKHGLDLDYIVKSFKEICDSTTNDKVKLTALVSLLKSVGLEKYEENEDKGKNWEQLLLEIDAKEKQLLPEAKKVTDVKYEVVTPEIPKEEKERREEEDKNVKSIYE